MMTFIQASRSAMSVPGRILHRVVVEAPPIAGQAAEGDHTGAAGANLDELSTGNWHHAPLR
jgi:hypothetical protein